MNRFVLIESDGSTSFDYEVKDFKSRPCLIEHKNKFYSIKETKTINDGEQYHFYTKVDCYKISE